ncbi:hypothetical protein DMA11_13765 [Marinilabiliaceae bacterium JC017]|nr:hypothetical protein DMA11_13765 [Marinilabiliaceae bacterium JC017]
MSKMNESKKRDFVSQIITLVEEEKESLIEKGYDPSTKVEELVLKKSVSDKAEITQQEAAARAKEATTLSNEKLDEAYKEASNFADLLSGLLGKDNELIKKMRKFRN